MRIKFVFGDGVVQAAGGSTAPHHGPRRAGQGACRASRGAGCVSD